MKPVNTRSFKGSLVVFLLAALLLLTSACTQTGQSQATVSPTAAATIQATQSPAVTEEPSYFNATGYPICDTPITLTVTGDIQSTPDWNATVQVEQIAERLGIVLDCSPIASDAWDTQLTLMLSSDSLPDLLLLTGLSATEVADYGSQGYFLSMGGLIDQYAPNLLSYMDKYDMLRTYMTSSDGNIYMTVQINDNLVARVPRVFMNKNWLANTGMEAPSTIDELYDVLVAFKEQDANGNGDAGDEIPMSNLGGMETVLLTAFGINTRSTEYLLQADESGKVYAADTTDNYKAYLTFLNKLYEEGLLDSENFIQTTDEFRAKVAEDTIGFFADAAPYVAASKEISYDSNFIWSGAYTSEWNDTPKLVYTQAVGSSPVVIASAKTAYPEAIVRLLDYFYTEEGQNAGHIGYEGLSFDYKDFTVGGSTYKIYEMYCPEGYDSAEAFRYQKAVINNGFYMVKLIGTWQPLYDMDYETLLSDEVMAQYGWGALTTYYGIRNPQVEEVLAFPALIYTAEDGETRTSLNTDIQLYLKSAKAQFVTGEVEIETGWESYLATLEQMGLSDLVAIDQGAYDQLMANAQ